MTFYLFIHTTFIHNFFTIVLNKSKKMRCVEANVSYIQPKHMPLLHKNRNFGHNQHPFVYYTKIHTRSRFRCGNECVPPPSINFYMLRNILFLFLPCVSFFSFLFSFIFFFFFIFNELYAVVEWGMTMFALLSLLF